MSLYKYRVDLSGLSSDQIDDLLDRVHMIAAGLPQTDIPITYAEVLIDEHDNLRALGEDAWRLQRLP